MTPSEPPPCDLSWLELILNCALFFIPNIVVPLPSIHHLYLHVPFCAKVCPYCAFYVHRGGVDYQEDFVQALRKEIEQASAKFPLDLKTIYFGGGTPSLLSVDLFQRIAEVLPKCAGEMTLEVNPKTVTPSKAAAWRKAGINRISLGAQSFEVTFLQRLGRDHTPDDIVQSVQTLREAGFTNISLDLMFALPNQPRKIWIATLEQALRCQPTHLSCYGLTYEEDTPFFESLRKGAWKRNEADEIWMFTETERILSEAGLPPYEISNFARPGFESQHNRAYWLGADYLGVGPSAYTTLGSKRWQNIRDTRQYMEKVQQGASHQQDLEELSEETRQKERWMFGLRMREGITILGTEPSWPIIDRLRQEGLLSVDDQTVKLTTQGRLVADSIAEYFA